MMEEGKEGENGRKEEIVEREEGRVEEEEREKRGQ